TPPHPPLHPPPPTSPLSPYTTLFRSLATKAELRLIPGIGDALAQRIVDHRDNVGPFRSVDELRKVAGIGPKTLERLRHQFFVTRSEEHTSELQSRFDLVCRLLLGKKK